MCIAILNDGKKLSYNELYNSYENNNQGCGLLYAAEGKLRTFKTFDFSQLYSEYNRVYETTDSPILLHFRIATSGKHNTENLHPFLVSENIGFVHNGVFSGIGDKFHSDTYYFCEYLKEFSGKMLLDFNSFLYELLESYCGENWSKLIFLNNLGEYRIVNESAGTWENGNWFSNNSHKKINDYVFAGSKKVKKSNLILNSNSNLENEYNWVDDPYYYSETEETEGQFCDLCGQSIKTKYSYMYGGYICQNCEDYFNE